MTQTIHCPSCQRMLRVPDNLLGQAVKCPSCEQTFTAPEDADAVPPPRPAPPRPAPEEEPERPARRLARRPIDDDDDEDYRRRRDDKPGKVQAIAIMTLIGGIMACITSVILMLTIYGLCWPGTYYGLVMGIMAIVKGSQLLGDRAADQPPPSGLAIMQIINIVNCDWINLTLGIISLVFLGDEEVKRYFRGR